MAESPAVEAIPIDRLLDWFRHARRDLPWRSQRGGYTALVAEAMLQQTQVSRVIDRFDRFIARFPTVESLAHADEQEVLEHWQGLGYYRRARHLHAAAKLIVEQYGGKVPSDVKSLQSLPGVGRYTAGAIASIVFGRAEPIVDGNVQRVLARWFAYDQHSPDDRQAVQWTWQQAGALVERAQDPGMFNEALMELGSLICTPRQPGCHACPVQKVCAACREGRTAEIPPPKSAPVQKQVHHHAVAIRRGDRWLVEQRGRDGLWAGLWQVPTVEADRALRRSSLPGRLPVRVQSMTPLAAFDHQTSHRRIRFHVYQATSRVRKGDWRRLDAVEELPLSVPQRRIVSMLAGSVAGST